MLLIDTHTTNPHINIAAEEYFFRRNNEEILILYVNYPSVIVGKHQNCYEEINPEYVVKNNIPVIRRISGGGTVYHDEGNLNFTFITNSDEGKQVNFRKFIEPLNSFLVKHGISPEIGDKNEIRYGGLKFSGNAEHVFRNRVLHHGTILFSTNLRNLSSALKQGEAKFKSRSVHSNRTSVGNLGGSIKGISTVDDLKDELFSFFMINTSGSYMYNISEEDNSAINSLVKEKYSGWEWNYAYGPAYELTNDIVISGERYKAWLKVEKGYIRECRLEGCTVADPVAGLLIGKRHMFEDVKQVLNENNVAIDEDNIFRFFA